RCRACRTQFEVAGAGRFACPVCGSVNVVRGASPQDKEMGVYPTAGGMATEQPQPHPAPVLPPFHCPARELRLVVARIAVAACPNCNAEVPTGQETEETTE